MLGFGSPAQSLGTVLAGAGADAPGMGRSGCSHKVGPEGFWGVLPPTHTVLGFGSSHRAWALSWQGLVLMPQGWGVLDVPTRWDRVGFGVFSPPHTPCWGSGALHRAWGLSWQGLTSRVAAGAGADAPGMGRSGGSHKVVSLGHVSLSTKYPAWTGYWEGILPWEGGQALAQVAQRSCGCPWIPGSVPGQVGRGLEQPGTVESVPAHGRGGTGWALRSLHPKPFHDSQPSRDVCPLVSKAFLMQPGEGRASVLLLAPGVNVCSSLLSLGQDSVLGAWGGVQGIPGSLRLERSSQVITPTLCPTPTLSPAQSTECHLQSLLGHLQGWGLPHLPGQPLPMFNSPFQEEKFLLVSNLKLPGRGQPGPALGEVGLCCGVFL
ncbi:uncharacterized protein LOC127464952 isoform X2 [Manacus candei]|uniref:uncharacterized protein LOC127464952 isoform X2 n=1 Tax=Manacus candei TaxID=415023 RepID=UPI0022279314|nr:uncharacterized protein LOC127464952 isoform X2 [Manacus candei]